MKNTIIVSAFLIISCLTNTMHQIHSTKIINQAARCAITATTPLLVQTIRNIRGPIKKNSTNQHSQLSYIGNRISTEVSNQIIKISDKITLKNTTHLGQSLEKEFLIAQTGDEYGTLYKKIIQEIERLQKQQEIDQKNIEKDRKNLPSIAGIAMKAAAGAKLSGCQGFATPIAGLSLLWSAANDLDDHFNYANKPTKTSDIPKQLKELNQLKETIEQSVFINSSTEEQPTNSEAYKRNLDSLANDNIWMSFLETKYGKGNIPEKNTWVKLFQANEADFFRFALKQDESWIPFLEKTYGKNNIPNKDHLELYEKHKVKFLPFSLMYEEKNQTKK